MKNISRSAVFLLLAGVVLITSAVVLGILYAAGGDGIEWQLTIRGKDGEEKVLEYHDVLKLPKVESRGGYFSTVGVVYGPYDVKGVPVLELCGLVGGMGEDDVLLVSAKDGYSSVYDYSQVSGDIDTFVPDPIKQVPHGELEFLLIYEMDGEPLSDVDGRPFRLAITSTENLITEGHWWVKWVDRLEIRRLPAASASDEASDA